MGLGNRPEQVSWVYLEPLERLLGIGCSSQTILLLLAADPVCALSLLA